MQTDTSFKLLSGVVLAALFATGVAFGAGLMRYLDAPHRPPPGGPFDAMTHELALDDAQRARLRAITDAHRGELDAIARDMQPRIRGALFAIEEELVPALRPDQVERLHAWRARRPPPPGFGGPGGPPPPPP